MNAILDEVRIAIWAVWNRRWIALAIAWAICVLGWLAVAMIPNSYQSRARLFVQLDDVLAEQIGIGVGSRKKKIELVTQTLTSSINLEKVIRSTELGGTITTDREMEAAVQSLVKSIGVKAQQANLFEITAEMGRSDLSDSENAQLAQEIVQKLIDIFREENLGSARGEMRETIDFLDEQLAARQKELEASEQERLAFEAQHPEMIGGAAAIAQKLGAARSEMRGVDADLAAAESALAAVEGQLSGTPRTIVVPGQSGGAKGALLQARSDLAGMQARGMTDSHPDVKALKQQIASLEKQAQAEGSAAGQANPAYISLQSIRSERLANIQALQSRKAALQSEINRISEDQELEPGVAAEAQRISRDYDVLRRQYDDLRRDREELRLRGQVETERNAVKFEVIDPPTTPRAPSAPNRPLLLFGVLIVGLGAGAGGAWALGQLRSSFATAEKLETTFDLPVVGTISHVTTQAGRAVKKKQLKFFAAGTAALGGLFVILLVVEFIQRGMVA